MPQIPNMALDFNLSNHNGDIGYLKFPEARKHASYGNLGPRNTAGVFWKEPQGEGRSRLRKGKGTWL